MTEDEMVGWHHRLSGHGFEQTLGGGEGLGEAEDIKKRWQKYTEELYKKDLHDPDNHDGVITDL